MEDVEDCMKRVEDVSGYEWPLATLLDLRKAYPRVSKLVLLGLLEKYGIT